MAGGLVNWHLRVSIVIGVKTLQDAWRNLDWSLELTKNRSKRWYLNFIVAKTVVQQVGYHLIFFDWVSFKGVILEVNRVMYCSYSTIEISERRRWPRSGVFIVNIEHRFHKLFWCLYIWFWIRKRLLGENLDYIRPTFSAWSNFFHNYWNHWDKKIMPKRILAIVVLVSLNV